MRTLSFLEVTNLALRSGVYRLQKPGEPLRFVLFPMIHMGSSQYYATVADLLAACEVILVEGVQSWRVSLITTLYGLAARGRGMQLVTQASMDWTTLRPRIVCPDMSGAEFDRRWGRLPLRAQLLTYVLAPVAFVWLSLFGSRALLAAILRAEEQRVQRGVPHPDADLRALDSVILDERDRLLVRQVREFYLHRHGEASTVAVVYGAAHMPAVAELLLGELHYRVARTKWITVFEC